MRTALVALVLFAAHVGAASAAQVTLQPSPAEARTFAATNGGWSSAVDYGGLVCIPGVTCPAATPSYQSTGGAGGAGDGFLRNGFATLLGVLSTTTITWTSPSFTAPAATDAASLSVDVRPQIASLLAIGSLTLGFRLIDVADGTRSTALGTVPLTAASSSFSTVSVTVAPSAVIPGRTYRVAVDTALTTSVSAVTSGNVDLDDVVLRLTDLEPPTGLAGTFQTTGSPRVDGSVDPLGQTTSVTVDYGPTAAYGSSTTPVTVSGSGSQPFTVPLAGLTPGATYHYRTVAQNADGSTSTGDATFVAPTPPDDAAAAVTGAGNSRSRTAVFSRAPDVRTATVEVLDGARSVVGSFGDDDADGQVAITLPDADGTYYVRVVRENASAQSSTSAEVPVTLDRVPPSTAGVDLGVAPVVSSSTSRTVTFTPPGDAVSATVQVLDRDGRAVGAPVPAFGGSAVVQLGIAEGDYTVRLTLADAAGNGTTVDSDPVTLDTTAPTAGGAPTVTGPGNSRDRTVTFDRDPTTVTATIEALDRDGAVLATSTVPVGATGTIRLPDTDGAYTIRVRQADLGGNTATTPVTPVTLDRVPPSAGPAPTVTGADGDRDRSVSFTRDPSTTSAAIELLDRDGNLIDSVPVPAGSSGAVRLPDADGTYRVRIRQTDAATNSATTPEATVMLDRAAPDPGPAPTVTGADVSQDRTVTFTRAPDAAEVTIEVLDGDGTIVQSVPVPAGSTGAIRLPEADGTYRVRVRQSDAAGNGAATPETTVRLDRGAPAPGAAPAVTGAGNSRERTVRFTRDPTATGAAIEVRTRAGALVLSVGVPSGDDGTITLPDADGDYLVRVRQTNAGGFSSLTPSTAISLDRTPPDAGPAPTVSGPPDALVVGFRRAGDAATVVVEVLDGNGNVVGTVPVPSGETAIVDLPDAPGGYGIRVRQTDAAGNSAVTPVTSVTRTADGGGGGGTGGGDGGGGGGGGAGGGNGDGALPLTDPGRFGTLLRQCFGGDVVLTDVTARGARVTVTGLSRYAPGTAVKVVDLAGRTVGSAKVGSNGSFAATVRAPASARARLAGGYRAVVGTVRSPVVRLRRANVLTAVSVAGTTITIRGRVDLARLGGLKRMRVYGGAGATACRSSRELKAIGTVKVDRRTGAYLVRVRAPAGSGRLVVRTRAFGSKLASRSSFAVK